MAQLYIVNQCTCDVRGCYQKINELTHGLPPCSWATRFESVQVEGFVCPAAALCVSLFDAAKGDARSGGARSAPRWFCAHPLHMHLVRVIVSID
jgi:hypothetical protein